MVRVENLDMTFFHASKCAGSSIENWLRTNVAGDVYDNDLRHLHPKQLTHLFPEGFGWSFCVVRNPWDRMVSWYTYFKKIRGLDISFTDYLDRSFFDKSVQNTNMYGKPVRLINYVPHVSHVVRFESLVQDFKIVQEKAGCFTPLDHTNKTRDNDAYVEYYSSQKYIDLVQSYYVDDIKLLGYSFGG